MTLFPEENKNTHFISMEGLKHETIRHYFLEHLKEAKNPPVQVELCVDNDPGGHKFLKKMTGAIIRNPHGRGKGLHFAAR
ncbi:MAG: hypothetical protein FWF59_00215 [Turicibacter sp.]|nr:hypothetical protein [Turicibacter sp.]